MNLRTLGLGFFVLVVVVSVQEGFSCARSSFGDSQMTQVNSGRLSPKFSSGAIWWGRKHAIGEVSLRPMYGLSSVLRLTSGSHAAVSGSRESVAYV